MAFEELKERINLVPAEVEDLVRSNLEYYKLSALKYLVKGTSGIIKGVFVGVMLMFLCFFLAIAAALAVGELLESYALGFLCIGGFFLLLLLIVLLLGRFIIDRTLLIKFSKLYFDNEKKGKTVIHKKE